MDTPSEKDRYDVSLSEAIHYDTYDNTTKVLTDTISFIITNNEEFNLDCSAVLRIDNTSNRTALRGYVGTISPGQQKNVSMDFIMYDGQSDISITHDCLPSQS